MIDKLIQILTHEYSLYFYLILFPILEGWKEVKFQKINIAAIQKASKMDRLTLKHMDMDYKAANAVLYLMFSISAAICLENHWLSIVSLIFTHAAWRWIMYDGILNLGRNLPFGYSGTTNRSIFDVILKQSSPIVDLIIKSALFLFFLTLYLYSHV